MVFGKFWRLVTWSVLGLVVIVLTSCLLQPSPLLRIGTNLWPGYETLYLARSLGYYDDWPIELVDYPSGTEEVRAYRNRDIEGAGLSIDQALTLAATQGDVRIIAIMDVSDGGDVILGKPEITTMQALQGKRVGVESTALGAFFLARALEENGMEADDVQIVSLEVSEHERAFTEGRVDAVVTFGPPRATLLEAGATVLFDSSQIPGEIVDTLVVREEAIATSAETIQALVDGRFRALQYFNQYPEEAARRIAPRTGVTATQILDAFAGLRQPDLQENQRLLDQTDPALLRGMQRLIEVMIDHKLLPQSVDPTTILDDRFVKHATL